MATHIRKNIITTAYQWFKNGDHPLDDVFRAFEDSGKTPTEPREGAIVRYFRNPEHNGDDLCKLCEKPVCAHGWIDGPGYGYPVCPGDYIVTEKSGEYVPIHPKEFRAQYEPIPAAGIGASAW